MLPRSYLAALLHSFSSHAPSRPAPSPTQSSATPDTHRFHRSARAARRSSPQLLQPPRRLPIMTTGSPPPSPPPRPLQPAAALPLPSTPPPSPASDYSSAAPPPSAPPTPRPTRSCRPSTRTDRRTKIYGWFNGRLQRQHLQQGRRRQLSRRLLRQPQPHHPDQQVLYIERLPDTVQTDHFDWGFRFAQL